MRVIYIAGPYRGKTENEVFANIMRAREVAYKLWQENWVVICPHLNTMLMSDHDVEKYLTGSLELLSRCDDIFMLKGWKQSEGAVAEYELAQKLGLGIWYE